LINAFNLLLLNLELMSFEMSPIIKLLILPLFLLNSRGLNTKYLFNHMANLLNMLLFTKENKSKDIITANYS